MSTGGSERRVEPREATLEAVKLVEPSGRRAFDAVAVDRSLRGLRVRLADAGALPGEVMVLSRAAGTVLRAKVMWRSAPYAGLSILATVELRSASGPDAAAMHRLWREHMAG